MFRSSSPLRSPARWTQNNLIDFHVRRSFPRSPERRRHRTYGTRLGPDFGKNKHNPSRDIYTTKADVVKLIEQAVADGANLIAQQGDAW